MNDPREDGKRIALILMFALGLEMEKPVDWTLAISMNCRITEAVM